MGGGVVMNWEMRSGDGGEEERSGMKGSFGAPTGVVSSNRSSPTIETGEESGM